MSLGEIARIVDGVVADADPSTVVTGSIEFDSRLIRPGGLFVAFTGDRVDGHDYVSAAVAAGAEAALVTRSVDAPSILVGDAVVAMGALAGAVVRRLPEASVIGVTGSSGKTSTKDMLAHVLAKLGPTIAPPGSFNNELGHPYTVLRADETTRYLVLETSARGVGHISYLTRIAPPRIGVVLNVGSAHLGVFGSRAAIAQAKGELVEALPSADDGGVAVLNADDPLVAAMRSRTPARVVTFGTARDADVRALSIELDDLGRPRFTLSSAGERAEVALRYVGAHHVGNALATAAVAIECGMSVPQAAQALGAATPASRWRMEVTERVDGVLVVNDAYNANPESMRAALEALAGISARRHARSVAVLGVMAELGADADAEHVAIGRLAARLGIAQVVVVGAEARGIEAGTALEGSWRGNASWVPDIGAAVALLRGELRPGDVVLVKASRAASLERVAAAITDDFHQDEVDTDGPGGTAA
ncbi:MAG TPA: UDP-N-acetylmuramoyl-tripeptide--D-alanyl-D-alanine ligase [Jatrophihabitantaceae bacterium]|nr:UDP-N-acetylmuramoyl-tripeptide--D-alanyl-D-alanine ligase [Jatrophihabitantaceae bacterium]